VGRSENGFLLHGYCPFKCIAEQTEQRYTCKPTLDKPKPPVHG